MTEQGETNVQWILRGTCPATIFKFNKDNVVMFLIGIDFTYLDMIVAAVFPSTMIFASLFTYLSITSPCRWYTIESINTRSFDATFDKTKTINVRKTWNSKRVPQKMAPSIHHP